MGIGGTAAGAGAGGLAATGFDIALYVIVALIALLAGLLLLRIAALKRTAPVLVTPASPASAPTRPRPRPRPHR